MADELSRKAANERVEKLKARLKGMETKARTEGGALMATGTQLVTAGALAVADEYAMDRNGQPALIGNLDNTLVVGALGTGLAMFGVGGAKVVPRMRDVGNAGFTIFGYKWAFQAMADRRAAAAQREAGEGEETASSGRASSVRGS